MNFFSTTSSDDFESVRANCGLICFGEVLSCLLLICFCEFVELFIVRATKAINRRHGSENFGIKEEEQVVKEKPNLEDGELADDDEKRVIYIYIYIVYVLLCSFVAFCITIHFCSSFFIDF